MIKGHMDQTQQNQQSTCTTVTTEEDGMSDQCLPAPKDGACMHHCYAAFMEPTSLIYSDLTGWFVAPSSSGNNYILIIYDYNSNAILMEAFKTCHTDAILEAYKCGHAWLCTAGLHPKLQCLDNKSSCTLQEFMTAKTIDYQLVPLHVHHCNTAECTIHTFKIIS